MRNFRCSKWMLLLLVFAGAGCVGPIPPGDPGDLDQNGVIDATDLDLLLDRIAQGSADLRFDINGDGVVDINDVNALVEYICERNGGQIDAQGRCCQLADDGMLCCDQGLDGTFEFCQQQVVCARDEDCGFISKCPSVCDADQGICVCQGSCLPGARRPCECDNALEEMPDCYVCSEEGEWLQLEFFRDPCLCVSSDECQSGFVCDAGSGQCVLDCRIALVDPCVDQGKVCDDATGQCVVAGCTPGDTRPCECDNPLAQMPACWVCTDDGEWAQIMYFRDPCQCLSSEECQNGFVCDVDSGQCVTDCRMVDCDICGPLGLVCDPDTGLCAEAKCKPGDTKPCECQNALNEMPACFVCDDAGEWQPIVYVRDPCLCVSDEDCQPGTTCNLDTGICEGPVCEPGETRDCQCDNALGEMPICWVCDQKGTWQQIVYVRDPCLCMSSEECLSGYVCETDSGQCVPDCRVMCRDICGEQGLVCDFDTGLCVAPTCKPGDKKPCDCDNDLKEQPICWECGDDGAWHEIIYVRDPCQCVSSEECREPNVCDPSNGQCVPDCRKVNCADTNCLICQGGSVCDPGSGLCVPDCRMIDFDICGQQGLICDEQTGACIPR